MRVDKILKFKYITVYVRNFLLQCFLSLNIEIYL